MPHPINIGYAYGPELSNGMYAYGVYKLVVEDSKLYVVDGDKKIEVDRDGNVVGVEGVRYNLKN
jgi:hypothetical protein